MIQNLQKFKYWRYTFLSFLGLLIWVGVLSGCAKSSTRPVNLQLSTWGSAQEIAVTKALLQKFEKTHPRIQVELLHIPENYYQKLHILVAGGLTPDVIFTNSLSFPIYASHGVFQDLTPFLDKASPLQQVDFFPAALEAFKWKVAGSRPVLGALPRDISNLVIFYNKNLFEKAGVEVPSANWDWSQLIDTASALTIDQNHDGSPEQFGMSFYTTPPLFWLPFLWSAGGDIFNSDLTSVTMIEPAAIQGLQFYSDLRNRYGVAPTQIESGGATMSQLFMQQKIAMMINGRWSVPVLREQAEFAWDVLPFPKAPGGKSRVGIDASGYAMSATTKYPKESFELIAFLLSRSAIEKVTESGLIVPARVDVAQSDSFLSPGNAPAHSQVFLDVIADGVPTNTPPRWNEISEELGLALQPVWEGKKKAADAVVEVQPKLQRLLEVGAGRQGAHP